ASSAVTPYFTTKGAIDSNPPFDTRSIKSASMQPPETEPCTWPSSRKAIHEPGGRGAEPQVRATVMSAKRCPSSAQRRTASNTCLSVLCMRVPLLMEALNGFPFMVRLAHHERKQRLLSH